MLMSEHTVVSAPCTATQCRQNHNYASRHVCNRCKGPKPPAAELVTLGGAHVLMMTAAAVAVVVAAAATAMTTTAAMIVEMKD